MVFAEQCWNAIKVVCIDLDGVVYLGDSAVPGSQESIDFFRDQGKIVRFVTNNSARTRENLAIKLQRLGITTDPNSIVNSGWAAARYLEFNGIKEVYVIGTSQLSDEIRQLGITVTSHSNPNIPVLLGFDPNFDFKQLTVALRALKDGAKLIVCNRERTFPGEHGALTPGLGPIVAALEYAANIKASHVVGKPDPWMLTAIQQELKVEPSEIVMIGDSLESDIAMAQSFGCPSIGIGTSKNSSCQPDLVFNSLLETKDYLRSSRVDNGLD